MADARREHEFDVAIGIIAFLGQSFNGKFRPADANPYRDRGPEREKTPEEKAEESKEGWELLGAALKSMAGSRGR